MNKYECAIKHSGKILIPYLVVQYCENTVLFIYGILITTPSKMYKVFLKAGLILLWKKRFRSDFRLAPWRPAPSARFALLLVVLQLTPDRHSLIGSQPICHHRTLGEDEAKVQQFSRKSLLTQLTGCAANSSINNKNNKTTTSSDTYVTHHCNIP